jgi:hypothetical protein
VSAEQARSNLWSLNRFQRKFLALWLARPHHPVVAAMGGWGIGKTRLIAQMMQMQAETQPGVAGGYATDSMGRGGKTIGREIGELLEPIGWRFRGAIGGAPAPHWVSPVYGGAETLVFAMSWKRHSTQDKSANSFEGPDLGWMLIDECNAMHDDEPAKAALGRIRSGSPPQLGLLGKPRFGAWWVKFAADRGGVSFHAPSSCNREHLPGYDDWVRTLSRREFEENVLCRPQPPEGAVYSSWRDTAFPAGNLAPDGWVPDPSMRTWVTMDFGVRSPSALIISHDPTLGPDGCDVVWAEAHPDDASIHDACGMVRRHAWPSRYARSQPESVTMLLHGGAGDKAGGQRYSKGEHLTTDLSEVAERPEFGGLGIRLATTTTGERVNILNGIRVTQRRICTADGTRSLLCCPKLWRRGLDGEGRSFAKSITSYRWSDGARGEVPRKDDVHDHAMDALRYFVINFRWPTVGSIADAARALRKRQREVAPVALGHPDR